MAPPAKKAMTPTASATGPESESLTLLRGVSQGRPPPEEAKAGSVRTKTATAAIMAKRKRLSVLGDITKLLMGLIVEDVLAGSHALHGHELSDPARFFCALDRHNDIDRIGKQMRHRPLARLGDQLFHPGEGRARIVRMYGRDPARVAGVPCLEQSEC